MSNRDRSEDVGYGRPLFVFLKTEFFHRFQVGEKNVELRQYDGPADLRWSPKHVRAGRPVVLRRGMSTKDEVHGFVGRAVWVNHFDALPGWARDGCGVKREDLSPTTVDPSKPLVAFEVVPQ